MGGPGSRVQRPRLPFRCRAILSNPDERYPLRRCPSPEVLAETGYCPQHSFKAGQPGRYETLWALLGPDWEERQKQLALLAPDLTSPIIRGIYDEPKATRPVSTPASSFGAARPPTAPPSPPPAEVVVPERPRRFRR